MTTTDTGMTGTMTTEATQVAHTVKDEARSLMDQGRGEMRQMMTDRSRQAADGLRRIGDELGCLVSGNPDQAQRLQGYLEQARGRVNEWAGRLDAGGIDGVMADVRQYARRRPGMFLLGATGAGFVMGRMLRVGASAGDQPGYRDTTGGTQNGVRGVGGQGWVDTSQGPMVASRPGAMDPQRDDPTVVVTASGGDPW